MATQKKPGRKAHVGRPSNAELARRAKTEEMKGTNPKVKKGKEEISEGLEEVEDAGKGIMAGARKFFSGIWETITKAFSSIPGFLTGLWEGIKSVFTNIGNFLKAFTDKVKVNLGANRAKTIFSLILILASIVLTGQLALTYFTLQEIAIGAAAGCVLSYGVARATMPEDLRKASSVNVKEIFTPGMPKAA